MRDVLKVMTRDGAIVVTTDVTKDMTKHVTTGVTGGVTRRVKRNRDERRNKRCDKIRGEDRDARGYQRRDGK